MTEIGEPDFLIPPVRHDSTVHLAESDPAWADQLCVSLESSYGGAYLNCS